jgi:hypothetical protein
MHALCLLPAIQTRHAFSDIPILLLISLLLQMSQLMMESLLLLVSLQELTSLVLLVWLLLVSLQSVVSLILTTSLLSACLTFCLCECMYVRLPASVALHILLLAKYVCVTSMYGYMPDTGTSYSYHSQHTSLSYKTVQLDPRATLQLTSCFCYKKSDTATCFTAFTKLPTVSPCTQ